MELVPVVAAAVTVQGWVGMCPKHVLVPLGGGFATEHYLEGGVCIALGAVQGPAVGERLEDHGFFGWREFVGRDLGHGGLGPRVSKRVRSFGLRVDRWLRRRRRRNVARGGWT